MCIDTEIKHTKQKKHKLQLLYISNLKNYFNKINKITKQCSPFSAILLLSPTFPLHAIFLKQFMNKMWLKKARIMHKNLDKTSTTPNLDSKWTTSKKLNLETSELRRIIPLNCAKSTRRNWNSQKKREIWSSNCRNHTEFRKFSRVLLFIFEEILSLLLQTCECCGIQCRVFFFSLLNYAREMVSILADELICSVAFVKIIYLYTKYIKRIQIFLIQIFYVYLYSFF